MTTQVDEYLAKNSLSAGSEWRVFPNPARDRFVIDGLTQDAVVNVELADVTGRVISRQTIESQNGQAEVSVDRQIFPAGIYLLRMATSQEQKVVRLVLN